MDNTDRGPLYKFLINEGITIKDSGERRQFDTGAVRDMASGKGRMDLLPWEAIMEVSKHCENGAIKYGEHNVDKGLPTHSFVDSAFRHLAKYTSGYRDEPHLQAACWNLLWALQMEICKPELCDIPWTDPDRDCTGKCRDCQKNQYLGHDVYFCPAIGTNVAGDAEACDSFE